MAVAVAGWGVERKKKDGNNPNPNLAREARARLSLSLSARGRAVPAARSACIACIAPPLSSSLLPLSGGPARESQLPFPHRLSRCPLSCAPTCARSSLSFKCSTPPPPLSSLFLSPNPISLFPHPKRTDPARHTRVPVDQQHALHRQRAGGHEEKQEKRASSFSFSLSVQFFFISDSPLFSLLHTRAARHHPRATSLLLPLRGEEHTHPHLRAHGGAKRKRKRRRRSV